MNLSGNNTYKRVTKEKNLERNATMSGFKCKRRAKREKDQQNFLDKKKDKKRNQKLHN